MTQDDLKIKETEIKIEKTIVVLPMRNWRIWIWDENDKRHTQYVKYPEESDVVSYCRDKGFTKYSIFNDKLKNINNDGESVKR